MTYAKYGNRKTEVDGITFDSKAESQRYQELKLLQVEGEVSGLSTQPSFTLQPAFNRDGKRVREIVYRADFMYFEGNKMVVEDVKGGRGTQTAAFKLKRKMFLYHYPEYELRIVDHA